MAVQNDTTSPFGTYAPNWWQRMILGFTRAMPTWEPTYRVALSLQKPLLKFSGNPFDVETYGSKIRFYPRDNVSERRALTTPERFDPAERVALLRGLSEGGTFVDLGANCGIYSLIMAHVVGPGGRVIAVEPQSQVYDRLAYNLKASGLSQVRALNIGVSDQAGTLALYENPENCGEATMAIDAKMTGVKREVEVRPLLDILADQGVTRVDALKIDIEGHEDRALYPFMEAADEDLLPAVIVAENSRKHWRKDWIALAETRGYRVTAEDRRNITLECLL
ncbi:MAG: FkbM family methyltransferase [Pseudomonadota bacterium]